MKQFFLITLLFCLLAGITRAAHVKGTVINVATGLAVPNQKVYIKDTNSNGYLDSVITNASGFYDDSLTGPYNPPVSGTIIVVYTTACFQTKINTHSYSGNTIISNFSVCRATISGTVLDSLTLTPVAGQKVFVKNGGSYIDSAVTNASGVYQDSLPALTMGDSLTVYTIACGIVKKNYPQYFGNNIISDFRICHTSYLLQGSLFLNGNLNSGPAAVLVCRKIYDPILKDSTLTVLDSIVINGGTYSKVYSTIPAGPIFLKAALLPGNSKYASYLPTYDTLAIAWSNGRVLTPAHFSGNVASNINMTLCSNPGGSGFLGGTVLVGANKGAAVGDPLANRVLLLTTSAGTAVAYAFSNSSGQFSFPNIALGTYKIFGDAWGKTNPALTITVTSYKPTLGNIIFEENSKTFAGRLAGVGVSSTTALNDLIIYPNPVTDHVQLNGLDAIAGNKTVILSELTGAVVTRQTFTPGKTASIGTALLAPGIYILQVQTEEGNAIFRIVK